MAELEAVQLVGYQQFRRHRFAGEDGKGIRGGDHHDYGSSPLARGIRLTHPIDSTREFQAEKFCRNYLGKVRWPAWAGKAHQLRAIQFHGHAAVGAQCLESKPASLLERQAMAALPSPMPDSTWAQMYSRTLAE